MTTRDIADAGADVLWMMSHYKGVGGQGELGADRVLYGLLEGRFGHVARQHKVKYGRIDFRYGTSNPVVIELVLRRPHDPMASLSARTNRSELRKLTRVRETTARKRALLLLDRSRHPIPKQKLRESYEQANAGRGRFRRHGVTVIYVHRGGSCYDFAWDPYAR